MSRQEQQKFEVKDLRYYFDAKEKDGLDSGKFCSKSRAVLALRDRLLALPDSDFESAIKTLNSIIDQNIAGDQSKQDQPSSSQAMNLYEKQKLGETVSSSKINPV